MSYDHRNDGRGFSPSRFAVRVMLKILWSVGGKGDAVDGLPRLWSSDVEPHLGLFQPGDFLLVGNNGVCSHVAVYAGEGRIIHSMATEKTMRGFLGSFWDAVWRPWRWIRGEMDHTGVIQEPFGGFLDRYERDTWLCIRRAGLTEAQRADGLERIRGLIGKAYDYGFDHEDDTYYCTEIAVEFLDGALHPSERPSFQTRAVSVPGLLSSQVIEPVALLDGDGLSVVAANEAARERYADRLEGAVVVR